MFALNEIIPLNIKILWQKGKKNNEPMCKLTAS